MLHYLSQYAAPSPILATGQAINSEWPKNQEKSRYKARKQKERPRCEAALWGRGGDVSVAAIRTPSHH